MTAPLLEIIGLNKSFGGVKATNDLNLSILPGELHAVIGPNGAGKTTLVSQLSGAQRPDSGKMLFKGRDIARAPAHRRAHMGIARSYQITSLIMDMTPLENVALAVQARRGHSFRFIRPAQSDAAVQAQALALLDRVGLADRAQTPTAAMSHGEHRHIEIAMALACDAELMLLDEPMAGLGPDETGRMVELLRGVKGSCAILLIEHDMDAVFALADRISVLVYGHVIATGDPEAIRADEAVRHAYLGEE